MNTPTRHDPLKEMESVHQRFNNLFGPTSLRPGLGGETMTAAEWVPLVDITEDGREFLIKAELPEVKKEDLKVGVENGFLTISGERRAEKEEQGRKFHRIERLHGRFVRGFTLPEGADGGKVSAEFKDGLLKIHVPKTASPQGRSVEVKVQ